VSRNRLARPGIRRRFSVGVIGASVAAVALLALTQGVGGASAASRTTTGDGWVCPGGRACLWNDVHRDGNSAFHLVITPDKVPDMELSQPGGGKGYVGSTTSAFHDSISQVLNLSPYDLCLIDTQGLGNGQYQSWGTILAVPAHGGTFTMGRNNPFNDRIDTYTTARPGMCPSYVRFNGTNSAILESQ